MNVLEKEIEDLVFECLSTDKNLLNSRGLHGVACYSVFSKQLDLGNYGRADLVCFKYNSYARVLDVNVVEFKKGEIGVETYLQALRYCKGLSVFIEEISGIGCRFEITLIGTSINKGDFAYMPDFTSGLSLYTVKIDLIKGIIFEGQSGYKLTNSGQPKDSSDLVSMIKTHIIKSIRTESTKDLPF